MMGSRTRLGRVGPLLLFIGFIGWNSQLLGGLVVTLQPTSSTTMHVGETAFLDVLVRTDSGSLSIDSFVALLDIQGGSAGGFTFGMPPATSPFSDSQYLFLGRSWSQNLGSPIGGLQNADQTFFAFDKTDVSGASSPVVLSTLDKLLFRVAVSANAIGDYQVKLRNPESAMFDGLGVRQGDLAGSIHYSVTAVPEPSSLGLCGLGTLGVSWIARRRRLRSIATSPSLGR